MVDRPIDYAIGNGSQKEKFSELVPINSVWQLIGVTVLTEFISALSRPDSCRCTSRKRT